MVLCELKLVENNIYLLMEGFKMTTPTIKFTDEDVVNIEDWIPKGEYNPHSVRPWLIHDHGFVVAVCFADCPQDALDIAADSKKLDGFRINAEDMKDYDEDSISYLGNNGEPFDIDTLEVVELVNVELSFAMLHPYGIRIN
jgi:hypothetical protein